jgi:hypothetical protein
MPDKSFPFGFVTIVELAFGNIIEGIVYFLKISFCAQKITGNDETFNRPISIFYWSCLT